MKQKIIISLATCLTLCSINCSRKNDDQGRSVTELMELCKGLDNKCYREEYAKDVANSSASIKFGMTVTTEGQDSTIMVFKTNQFTTSSLVSTKDVFIDLARMGFFKQVKFIGSDGQAATYTIPMKTTQ